MKVKVLFGTTNSQPVGIDDSRIEDTYQRAYKPFLRASYNCPDIPVTLYYSGHLLQWLDGRHSEFTDVLSEMGMRKQVELLGGAFYDPVLALVPRPDRLGQIERMTTHLRKRFGRRPRGAWITEQVWEPSLPSLLRTSGIDYTFLCDQQFIAGGLSGRALLGPCITEDEGKTVIVFPVSRSLCDLVGTVEPGVLVDALQEYRTDDEDQLLSLIFDGERYAEHFPDGAAALDWIRRFFDLLVENRDWIEVVTPWRYLRTTAPRRRGYFPPTSYRAVMGLAGPTPGVENGCDSDGFFRQFLTHYPESNLMYAKMQYTHILVNQLRGDKYRKQLAREELWKGQCHNAYWDGRHGGIHQNLLRKRIYSCLIEAEKVTREKGVFIPSVLSLDFDMDGLVEHLYQGHEINAYVHTQGGVLFELDWLPTPWNYLDTLARRRDPFASDQDHSYDVSTGRAFVDHIFSEDPGGADARTTAGLELCQLSNQLYRTESLDRDHDALELSVSIPVAGGALLLTKQFRFRPSGLTVHYILGNPTENTFTGWFASELNLGFLSDDEVHLRVRGDEKSGKVFGPASGVQRFDSTELEFHDLDNQLAILLKLSRSTGLQIAPLVTDYGSGDDAQQLYQGTTVMPGWSVSIEPGDDWSVDITVALELL